MALDLVFEALVVGIVLAAALYVVVAVRGPVTAENVLPTGLVVGALVHLAFESAGANAWYCRHGAACT